MQISDDAVAERFHDLSQLEVSAVHVGGAGVDGRVVALPKEGGGDHHQRLLAPLDAGVHVSRGAAGEGGRFPLL